MSNWGILQKTSRGSSWQLAGCKAKMKLFRDMGDLLKAMKRRKPSKKYCPRCGSPKISVSTDFDRFVAPRKYVCAECGYRGPIVMELEKEDQ